MAKRPKTIHVRDITHEKSGITIPLNVDRDSGKFHAKVGDQLFEDTEASKVVTQVWDAIEASLSLEWTPVIKVVPITDLTDQWNHTMNEKMLGFHMERQWVTLLPSGKRKYVRWDAKEDMRLAWSSELDWLDDSDGAFTPPCAKRQYKMVTWYLPYSGDAWELLSLIQGQIIILQAMLFEHLGDSDRATRLVDLKTGLAKTIRAWHTTSDTATIDDAFARLDALEESYIEKYGAIPPVTSRLQKS